MQPDARLTLRDCRHKNGKIPRMPPVPRMLLVIPPLVREKRRLKRVTWRCPIITTIERVTFTSRPLRCRQVTRAGGSQTRRTVSTSVERDFPYRNIIRHAPLRQIHIQPHSTAMLASRHARAARRRTIYTGLRRPYAGRKGRRHQGARYRHHFSRLIFAASRAHFISMASYRIDISASSAAASIPT